MHQLWECTPSGVRKSSADSVYIFGFIGAVFKEIKICTVAVPYPVRAGQTCHGPGEFPVLAVFIGKSGCVKDPADPLIGFPVITPFKPGLSSLDVQPEIQRILGDRNPGIEKLCLDPILQMDNGQSALSQGLTVILSEINVIHIIIIED